MNPLLPTRAIAYLSTACLALIFATANLRAEEKPPTPSATDSPAKPAAPVPTKPEAGEPPAPAEPPPIIKPKVEDDLLLEPQKMPGKPASGDDLLLGAPGDDLLLPGAGTPSTEVSLGQGPAIPAPKPKSTATLTSAANDHAKLLVEGKFPSASTCATCHPTQFREWSVSQHAYAQLSPIFNTMQATINKRTSGTNGDFCIRCHTQVGMQLKESTFMSNMDRHPASREGITCIVCHRVKEDYGKVSGRTAIKEGDIFEPVYGPKGNAILKQVLSKPDEFQVNAKRGEVGRNIHTDIVKYDPLEKSNFCGSCHDVNLLNGFRLEEAFTQFKNSQANKRGETCQDCHMGKTPGVKSGYAFGPAAQIGDKTTPPRKLTNHTFAGPDYPIIHPGLFPFNVKAQELATMREWLLFEYRAGWGTDAFEKAVPADTTFPPRWQAVDDRYDARAILEDQYTRLEQVHKERFQILRRGFQFRDFVVEQNNDKGLKFKLKVANGTDGHGVPTGFDAERANFLQVTVTDRKGKVIFRSGDRDPNGDVRDSESSYVHDRKLPVDKYLFNLQSHFLVTLLRGGERPQILPTNKSIDPLPYVRPPTNAAILLGRSNGARKQALVIPPGGFRWAPYEVEAKALTGEKPYKVNFKFVTQMVPINLVGDIAPAGFDYNMSAKEIAREVIEKAQILWDKTIVLPPKPIVISLKPTEAEIMATPDKPYIPELAPPKVVKVVELPAKKATPPPPDAIEKKPDAGPAPENKTEPDANPAPPTKEEKIGADLKLKSDEKKITKK